MKREDQDVIRLEVWLYGPLSRYAGNAVQSSHARLDLELPDGATMRDLLAHLNFPVADKGITFVNGRLTDVPGLAADLDFQFSDGDRVGFFHDRSMWPFQYRFGADMSTELRKAMLESEGGALRHAPGPSTSGSDRRAPPSERR